MLTLLRALNHNSPLSEAATDLTTSRYLGRPTHPVMTCGSLPILMTGDMAAENCDEISCPPDGALAESLKPAEGF